MSTLSSILSRNLGFSARAFAVPVRPVEFIPVNLFFKWYWLAAFLVYVLDCWYRVPNHLSWVVWFIQHDHTVTVSHMLCDEGSTVECWVINWQVSFSVRGWRRTQTLTSLPALRYFQCWDILISLVLSSEVYAEPYKRGGRYLLLFVPSSLHSSRTPFFRENTPPAIMKNFFLVGASALVSSAAARTFTVGDFHACAIRVWHARWFAGLQRVPVHYLVGLRCNNQGDTSEYCVYYRPAVNIIFTFAT